MAVRTATLYKRNVLGHGLVHPFVRAGTDFTAADGEALVRSCIRQILGTRRGELRWRPDFGSDLERFRHMNANTSMARALQMEVAEGVMAWEPRIQVSGCNVSIDSNIVHVRITWSVVSDATMGSNVLIGPITQEVAA